MNSNHVVNDLLEAARRDFPAAELLLVFLPEGASAVGCKPEDVEAFEKFEFLGIALVTDLGGDSVDLKCLTPRTNKSEQEFRHRMVRDYAVAEWRLSRPGEQKN